MLSVLSCTVNDLRDTSPAPEKADLIEGNWALVDKDSTSNTIYGFFQGKIFLYASNEYHFYCDETLWNCSEDDFVMYNHGPFSIVNDTLVIGNRRYSLGRISIDDNILTIGPSTFHKLAGLSPTSHERQRHITSVELEKHELVMNLGSSTALDVTVKPDWAVDKRIIWTSLDPDAVKVSADGVFSALAVTDTPVAVVASSFFMEKTDTCYVSVRANLSEAGRANCYIVSKEGKYCIDASVRGNSSEKITNAAYADVIWVTACSSQAPTRESIVGQCLYDINEKLIWFEAGKTAGNALVALFDNNGTILWSWHIWVCPGYDPLKTAKVYYNNAGTVMDRNLGALSADHEGSLNLTCGLYYQWGRKDPFSGLAGSACSATAFTEDFQWKTEAVDRNTGTIEYSVVNPTTFLKPSGDGTDWIFYSSGESEDFSRWQGGMKTKYDPCPAGWMVPDYNLWSSAMTGNPSFETYGINATGHLSADAGVWYPASGYVKDYKNEAPVTGIGAVWAAALPGSSQNLSSSRSAFMFDAVNRTWPVPRMQPSYGLSVRCVKE